MTPIAPCTLRIMSWAPCGTPADSCSVSGGVWYENIRMPT